MKDLGTLGGYESVAKGVNNRDQVVGYAEDSNRKQRASLWTLQGGIQNLNLLTTNLPSNVTLDVAAAINNQGQIAGWASVRLNHRAFLLTPVNVTNIPQMMMLLLSP